MGRPCFWAAAGALLATALACSGGGSSSTAVSASQACTDAAGALCNRYAGCSSFFVQLAYGDVGTCSSRVQTACTHWLAANGTGITPADMEACAAAMPGAACGDALGNDLPAACRAVAGQLGNGTPCGDDSQCQSQYCNEGTDGTCGACGVRSTGGACNRDDDCGYGSICVLGVPHGTCVKPGAAGATCDAMHPCNRTLACKNGTCATPDAAGTTCTVGNAGDAFGSCDVLQGLYCDPTSKLCKALGLANAGQTCGIVNGGYTVCSASGYCNGGTCAAAAADGASCNATTACVPPASCSGGVCKLPDPSTCH